MRAVLVQGRQQVAFRDACGHAQVVPGKDEFVRIISPVTSLPTRPRGTSHARVRMAASVVHRRWDIVLWGSTGFTGQLVARYFAEVLRVRVPGLRWALVGRDASKLRELSACLAPLCDGRAPDFLVASAAVQSEVDRVVEQARVVLSTAGPFARIGQPVIDACVRLGTHYVDINGEPGSSASNPRPDTRPSPSPSCPEPGP